MLVIKKLSFKRDYLILLENINFTLSKGELLQIHGANGSGKSTLLRILAGLIEPQSGEITWNNLSIDKPSHFYQQQLHYIGHLNAVKPYLTIIENLALYAALYNKKYHEKLSPIALAFILEKMELDLLKNRLALHLSAGQLRRLSLAKLLLHPLPIWILDEPVTALDNRSQRLFQELLTEHLAQKNIAIIATHHDLFIPHQTKILRLGQSHA